MTTNNAPLYLKTSNFPKLSGITFRKFRGEVDFETMAAITNAAQKADGEDRFTTVEEIRNNFAHMERSDPNKDMIFVEVEGQTIGYGRCWWSVELSGDYIYSFFINLHPDFRRDEIPLVMMEYLQERLLEIAAQHPADASKYFQSCGLDTAKWHRELMEQLGLAPVRYEISMTRPCSLPVEISHLPEGIEIRTVGPENYRKVFNADYDAFQDHWDYVPPTEADFKHWLNQPTFDPTLWKVAWDGDQVAGMVLNYIDHEENRAFNRERGYTEDIGVLPAWRRQGIARSLLTQSIQMFQKMGIDETALQVDTNNPNGALKLYESVGYKETKRFVFYRTQINEDD